MNYEPNTRHWRKGDIVLHDADAKEPKMLMRVVGYTRDGLCKTQYVDKRRRRTMWKNDTKYLHDPERFGITIRFCDPSQETLEKWQESWERVRWWNKRYQPGQRVRTTSADGGFEAVTQDAAWFDRSGCDKVYLKPGGGWWLKFVEAI